MTETIGYSTAYKDTAVSWESAEGVRPTEEETISGLRRELQAVGITEEDLKYAEPLYLTEVRKVRQITWDDLK